MQETKDFLAAFGNKTDTGKVRAGNEDYMECFKSSFGDVFVVCDGMGGHEGGEIASRLAVTTIKQVIVNNPNNLSGTQSIIEEAISVANKAILLKAQEIPQLKGMGTTCVILVIKDHKAYWGHIGDSRLYLLRQNTLYRMTKDHSFVQGLVDQGLLKWEEAENHPRKNEITKALGIYEKIDPDVNMKPLGLYKGDKFLLCSDGLSGPVPEEEIKEMLSKFSVIDASNALVEKANSYGGPDNITVQVIEVIKGIEPAGEITPEGAVNFRGQSKIKTGELPPFDGTAIPVQRKKNKLLIPGIIVIAFVLIIAAILIWKPFDGSTVKLNPQDSLQVKDSLKDSTAMLIDSFKTVIMQMYQGKNTNANFTFPPNMSLAKDFYYKGKLGGPDRSFTLEKLIKNIRENNLVYESSTVPLRQDSGLYRFELAAKFKEMYNTYEILIAVTADRKLEIKRIEFLRETKIAEEEKKKENSAPKINKPEETPKQDSVKKPENIPEEKTEQPKNNTEQPDNNREQPPKKDEDIKKDEKHDEKKGTRI